MSIDHRTPRAGQAPTGPGAATLTEAAPGVFGYLQPDGSWFISNTGFILGEDQVLSIDTCATEARTRAYLAAIRTVTRQPVTTLVNTHHHGDHTNGNHLLGAQVIVAQSGCRDSAAGIEVVKIPPRSPRANAYAERWVRTARAGVADRMLIAGPRHLRVIMREYATHFNHHRPHRARNLRPPDADDIATVLVTDLAAARIRRREVLGGLIHEYEQAA